MKIQILAAVLLAAAGITLTAEQPKIEGNDIVFGKTKVVCAKNGELTIVNGDRTVSTIACHYSVVNPAANKTDWNGIKEQDCTMTFENRKLTWILNRKAFGQSWKALDQTLEILEDGRLKLTVKEYPAPEGLRLYDNCVFMTFPIPVFKGKTMKFQGKDVLLDAGTKPISPIKLPEVRGVKGRTYTFPLDPGSVTFYSECWSGITAFNNKISNNFRLTWYLPKKTLEASFMIDIK